MARVANPRRSHGAGASAPTPACSSRFGAEGSAGAGGVVVTAVNATPALRTRMHGTPPTGSNGRAAAGTGVVTSV